MNISKIETEENEFVKIYFRAASSISKRTAVKLKNKKKNMLIFQEHALS